MKNKPSKNFFTIIYDKIRNIITVTPVPKAIPVEVVITIDDDVKEQPLRNIKKVLVEIGFHHAWGKWIYNDDRNIRVIIQPSTKKWKTRISITKDGYLYSRRVVLTCRETNEELLNIIMSH